MPVPRDFPSDADADANADAGTEPRFISDAVVDVPPYGSCRQSDIWFAWADAQADAEDALGAWAVAPSAERGERHAVYRAALDREAHAAQVLEAVVRAAAG